MPVGRSKRLHPSSNSTPYSHGQRSPKPARPTYLQRPQTDIQTNPNPKLTIFRIPREIFDEIVTYLPAPAKVCLSLSCTAAAHALGPWTTTWFLSRITQVHHRNFDRTLYDLLQRDLPDLHFCPRCEILHPPLKPPHAHRTPKFAKLCLGQAASMDYWPQTPGGYSVVFPHIERAFQSKPTSPESSPIDLFASEFTTQLRSLD